MIDGEAASHARFSIIEVMFCDDVLFLGFDIMLEPEYLKSILKQIYHDSGFLLFCQWCELFHLGTPCQGTSNIRDHVERLLASGSKGLLNTRIPVTKLMGVGNIIFI